MRRGRLRQYARARATRAPRTSIAAAAIGRAALPKPTSKTRPVAMGACLREWRTAAPGSAAATATAKAARASARISSIIAHTPRLVQIPVR